jgi:hypothetical protein
MMAINFVGPTSSDTVALLIRILSSCILLLQLYTIAQNPN